MKLKVSIYERKDYDDYDGVSAQRVVSENCPDLKYRVCNLCECPEDAIIGRDLFTAEDYLDAIMLGIELGSQGYDGMDITYLAEE